MIDIDSVIVSGVLEVSVGVIECMFVCFEDLIVICLFFGGVVVVIVLLL